MDLREILTLPDGGQVALDWRDDNIAPDAPILVALPGLTGCSEVEYMQNIALTMNAAGIRCVVFNNRGLGGMQLKVSIPTFYQKEMTFIDVMKREIIVAGEILL